MLKKFLKKFSKGKYYTKSISLVIALTLVFTSVSSNIAYAMPMNSAMPVINSVNTTQFVVPFNIGRITDALYNGKSKEIIVNIQDLHSHEQTQRNISNILSILDKKYGIDKIYVEGAIEKVDTSWIGNIADKDTKAKVINNLLKSGRLTGSELYAIESGKNGIIEGIENKEVYLKNVDRLNEIYNKKSEIEQYLPKIKYVLEESVKEYYSNENIKVNKVVEKNKNGKISASKYFEYIVRFATRVGIDINKYTQIRNFIGVIESKRGLKTELVNKEVAELLKEIKNEITFKEYKELTQKINNKEQETEFYNEIKRIAEKDGILSKYPNATKFFNYIQMNEGLNPVELANEEKDIIKEIQDRNSKTIHEKEAYFLSRYISLIEGYLSNKMTADEYTCFVNNKSRFDLLWKKYVDIDGILDVQKYFNLFEEFYKDNVERNRIFVEKITGKKVAKEIEGIRVKGRTDNKEKVVEEINNGKKIKVVITGGFHTYGFTRLLEDNGIDYCVITPNITEETLTAERLYENVFKEQYKLQNQTFQKMLVSQVLTLLNKGEIASVEAQGENVLIKYASGEIVNLNEIKEQQETETDKKVSEADAQKVAKIFAKTFFKLKDIAREDREQARQEALDALQGKTPTDTSLILRKTASEMNKKGISDRVQRAKYAGRVETLKHPILTFFQSTKFAYAHYGNINLSYRELVQSLKKIKQYEKERNRLQKLADSDYYFSVSVIDGMSVRDTITQLENDINKERDLIENLLPGFYGRQKGAKSIRKAGWLSALAGVVVTESLITLASVLIASFTPLLVPSIISGAVIGIISGYIGAIKKHTSYDIQVLSPSTETIKQIRGNCEQLFDYYGIGDIGDYDDKDDNLVNLSNILMNELSRVEKYKSSIFSKRRIRFSKEFKSKIDDESVGVISSMMDNEIEERNRYLKTFFESIDDAISPYEKMDGTEEVVALLKDTREKFELLFDQINEEENLVLDMTTTTSAKVKKLITPIENVLNKQYPNDAKMQGIVTQLKEDTARMLEENIRTEEQIRDLLKQFEDILNGKIDEKFMKQRAIKFGTAGARGTMNVANSEGIDDTIDFYTSIIIAQSVSDFINSKNDMPKTVFLQCDSRYLGTLFNIAMSRVFTENGIQVYMVDNELGTVSTPTGSLFLKDLYELNKKYREGNKKQKEEILKLLKSKYGLDESIFMAVSINVTASHNPGKYNGFKINMQDGAQFPSDMTKEVSSFINDIQSGKTKIKLSNKESVKLISGTSNIVAGKEIETKLTLVEKAHVEYLIETFKNVVDLEGVDISKISVSINGNNSVLVPELKALCEYFGISYVVSEKEGRDVAFDAKKPEPSEANMSDFAESVANIVIDGKVVFGIASDPDGDRFCIIDSDGTFITPNQIGLIVLNERLSNIQKQIEENKNINTAKQFEEFMGVVLKSHVTSPEIDVLAKKYSDKIYKIAESRLSSLEISKLDKKIAENKGFFSVENLPVGWKNIADRQKVIEKAGKKFIAGIESSGGLSLGVYDKDGALATGLPVLIAAKKGISFKEILSEIHGITGYESNFDEDAVVLDNQGKQDFLAWVNSVKKLHTDNQISVLKKLLSSLGIDVELADSIVWENEGLKIAIKDKNYESTEIATSFIAFRASGTEPKIRVYSETISKELMKEYALAGKEIVNGAYKNISTQETRAPITILTEIINYALKNKKALDIRNLFKTDRSAFEREVDLGNDTKIDISMARTNIDEKTSALLDELLESLNVNKKLDKIIEQRGKLFEKLLSKDNKAIQDLSKIADKIHSNGTKKVVFVMDEKYISAAESNLARMHDSRFENGPEIEFISSEKLSSIKKDKNTVYIYQSNTKDKTKFKFDYVINTSEIADTDSSLGLDILSSILPVMIYGKDGSFNEFIEGAKNFDSNKQSYRDMIKICILYRYVYGIEVFTLAAYDNFYEPVIAHEQKNFKGILAILGRVLTDAQHSFFQWIHQGVQKTFVVFIGSATTSKEIMQNKSLLKSFKNLLANKIAQADSLATGKEDTNTHKWFKGNRASVAIMKSQANATSAGAETMFLSTIAEIFQDIKYDTALQNIEPIQEERGSFKGFTALKEFADILKLSSNGEALNDSVTVEQTITLDSGAKITHKTNLSQKIIEFFNKIANALNIPEKVLDYIGRVIDNGTGKDIIVNRKVNTTEDRYVLHWAYSYVSYNKETNKFEAKGKVLVKREYKKGDEYFGNGRYYNEKGELDANGKYMDVMDEIIETLNKEIEFLNNLYNSGIKTVVSFGIGGSDLGPRNFSKILSSYKLPNAPEIRFVHNVDPNDINEALKDLDPATTYGIIQSKSFGTAETLANGDIFKNWLADGFKTKNPNASKEDLDKFFSEHFAAVSSQAKLVSEFGIDTEKNMFPFTSAVGGRYSVFSPVGLPLMLSIGSEKFSEALVGETAIYSQLRKDAQNGNLINNASFIMAIKNIFNINVLGKQVQAIDSDLDGFVAYTQQLYMESNGKHVTEDGEDVGYRTANAVVESIVLGEKESPEEVIKKQDGIEFSFSKNEATSEIRYEELTPEVLGALKALEDLKTIISALIWQIVPVDQWGVQLGKVVAIAYHKILMAGKVVAGTVEKTTQRALNFILSEQAKKTETAAKEAVERDAKAQAEKRDNLSTNESQIQSRPASMEDAVDLLSLPAEEQSKLETEGFERILAGEVSFAVLAAGDSSRMKASEAGTHIAGMEGKTVLSKAAVPINDKGDNFLSLYIENTVRLLEEVKAKAKDSGLSTDKIKNNTILIMTTAVYKAEQQEIVANKLAEYGYTNIVIETEEGKEIVTYRNANGEEITVEYFNQDKGIVEYATVKQVREKKRDYKDKKEYARALYAAAQRERAGQKAFEEESAPLGHGEFWHQMVSKGVYADLIGRGNRFVTLRNIDNVAALMNDVLVKEIGSLSIGEEDAYMEASPNAPGLAGGGYVIETDATGKEAARQYEFQANPIVGQSKLFNDAVGIFRLSMVSKIYRAEGESEEAFNEGYTDKVKAKDADSLRAISERGKARFKTYPATKKTKNKYSVAIPGEISEDMRGYFDEEELGILEGMLGTTEEIPLWSVKTESSAWGVSCIEVVRTKLISVWNGSSLDKFILDGLKNFKSLTKDVLKHLRFLATKQWTQTEENLEGIKDKVNAELRKSGVPEDQLIKDTSDLRVLLRAESYKWNKDIIQAYVDYVKAGDYLSDTVAPKNVSVAETMKNLISKALISPIEWLQMTAIKVMYGDKVRETIVADTESDDFNAMVDRAYNLSAKGIKVDLIILGKSTLTKELDRQIEVKQENGSVLMHLLKGKEIGNLTTYSYEQIEDTNVTKEDIAKAILQEYAAVSEEYRLLDLPKSFIGSSIITELESIYTSIKAGKSSLDVWLDAYKKIKNKVADSTVKPETMRAKYTIFNSEDKGKVNDLITRQDIEALKAQGISTLMLELSVGFLDQEELDRVLSLAKQTKMQVVLSFNVGDLSTMEGMYKSTETMKQFNDIMKELNKNFKGIISPDFVLNFVSETNKASDENYKKIKNFIRQMNEISEGTIEVKANGYEEQISEDRDFPNIKQLIDYNRLIDPNTAISLFDKIKNMNNVRVYVGSDINENMVVSPEAIQKLIQAGATLTFDSKVLREMTKSSENGFTLVDIISAMFLFTPEGQETKGKNRGRKIVLDTDKEFDNSTIEKMYALLNDDISIAKTEKLTGIKGIGTKEEAKGLLEGILEATELKSVAEKEGEIAFTNKDDLNKVMDLLMKYRLLSGTTYTSNNENVKKLMDSLSNNSNLTTDQLLTLLENKAKEANTNNDKENESIAIAGIIEILLMSKLQDIGIDLIKSDDSIQTMKAILSAA